ncbi:MAG: hypothetical protein DRP66_00845 [Planctomycetota bacterium]|nr:MAG: hypothetical protein DRP66_00845 [Planctomycetota bacterium]
MKLPEVKNSERYAGLYVVDFGDHSGVGFTADEVAELLDSAKFKHVKVFKIHKAYPDGKMELRGVRPEIFQLEMGMFFYSQDIETAGDDYKRLTNLAIAQAPPGRAKVHLAKYDDDKFVTALIYPAEYDDEFSRWLLDGEYKTAGAAAGGVDAVRRYYDEAPQVLQRRQLFGRSSFDNRTGEQLLAATKIAVQR